MTQLEFDLGDRQLVYSTITGEVGRLDRIGESVAFVKFPDVGHLQMCALKNIKPVDDLFVWPLYFGNPDGYSS